MHLETYDEAIKKQNKAQMTSDLSSDETCNTRTTRHERCRIDFSDNDYNKRGSNSTSKRRVNLPQIPVPPALQPRATGVSENYRQPVCDICNCIQIVCEN